MDKETKELEEEYISTTLGNIDEIEKKLIIEADKHCNFDKEHMESNYQNTNHILYWIKKSNEFKKKADMLDIKRKKKWTELHNFYKKEYSSSITCKEYLDCFIESDPSYSNLFLSSKRTWDIKNFCDSVKKALEGKAFQVQNWLEYQKFLNGK